MNRREFLGLLGKGAIVVGAGGLIVPAAKKIWQVPVQLKPLSLYKPKQFEDILQSTIQIVRDNYGQPTDMYLSSKDFADLEQELEESYKRCKESDVFVRTESLALHYHKFRFDPNNIKLWSSDSKA